MRRIALRYLGLACVLSALPLRIGASQNEDAAASRAPRFLLAMAERAAPVPVDLKRSAILRRPLSLAFDGAPIKQALAEISRQAGLSLVYADDVLPVEMTVSLRADRITVAAALTDDVASIITMARYVIEDAGQRLAHGAVAETSEALHVAGEQLREATTQVLALAGGLRPRLLDDLGLLPTLTWHCREFARHHRGIFVSQRVTLVESEVPPALKLTMFRIVQACLANVADHSKASAARILLTMIDVDLRLVIEDNGVGFDVARWQQGRLGRDGCGLRMIRHWVEASGGHCSIESTPRHGSRVQALWRLESVPRASDRPDPPPPDETGDSSGSPG